MSLVDIPAPAAEDETMDPATKQYVDSCQEVADARTDAKLAEFRAVVEAYMARADARDEAARERADAREAAAREREAAAREREAAAREREELRARDVERRMQQFETTVVGVKRAVVTTGIAATLSTVFGVAAFNAALIQSVQSAFEAGRQASPAQVKMQADIDALQSSSLKMQSDLDAIRRRLDELRPAKDG
ncbi:hypothetical protein [Pseudoduganella sp.]|uniref:hypothetical protein n=1 Tax=Pseudoduganella sp. TaxID=1880898 RepID=UPI0035B2F67C